jgi:hypothetical protein
VPHCKQDGDRRCNYVRLGAYFAAVCTCLSSFPYVLLDSDTVLVYIYRTYGAVFVKALGDREVAT